MSKNHKLRFIESHEETATEIMKRILSEKIVAQSGKKMTVREGICRRIAKNGANGHLPSADYAFRITLFTIKRFIESFASNGYFYCS